MSADSLQGRAVAAGGVQLCSGCHRSTEPGSGLWADRVERLDAAGRLSWVCVDCMADDSAPGWVFHNLDTGTIEQVTFDAYLVAVDELADEDRQVLEDSELAGWHGFGLSEVVSRVGVPVSDVLAVWSAVQAAGVSLSELVALLNTAAAERCTCESWNDVTHEWETAPECWGDCDGVES